MVSPAPPQVYIVERLGKREETKQKRKRYQSLHCFILLNFVLDWIYISIFSLPHSSISHERLKGKGTVLVPCVGCMWPLTAASYASSSKSAEDLVWLLMRNKVSSVALDKLLALV